MGYNIDFYSAYGKYLREPSVREAHDWIFSLLGNDFVDVIDLGCGRSMEFRNFCNHASFYSGIDENADTQNSSDAVIIKGNYRNRELLKMRIDAEHTAFLSLFSSEITAPMDENYRLYNWIFKTFPHIRAGLVSGFFYKSKMWTNPIKEAGGITSYQTLEVYTAPKRLGFTEKRIQLPVPSKMFGKDVIEVWKIFHRK